MLMITIENRNTCRNEFTKADKSLLVDCILNAHGIEGLRDKTYERLVCVFTTLRVQYRYTIEAAYNVAIAALDCCIIFGDCPTKTSLEHYRRSGETL